MNDMSSTVTVIEMPHSLPVALPDSCYFGNSDERRVGRFSVERCTSTIGSVNVSELIESDLTPYECSRLSGALSFWDEEGEDIYTFEDGRPV